MSELEQAARMLESELNRTRAERDDLLQALIEMTRCWQQEDIQSTAWDAAEEEAEEAIARAMGKR